MSDEDNVMNFYGGLLSTISTLSISNNDYHLISLYNITPESNIWVMRIKGMITNRKGFDC